MKNFVAMAVILVISVFILYVIIENKSINIMNNQNIKYGEIAQFHKNEILYFPDFSISYSGKTSEKVNYDSSFNFKYYNFIVTSLDNKKRTLIWSSGMGDFAPADFAVDDKIYQLELKYSEKKNKQLADNELVISLSKNDTSKYFFQLINKLSILTKHDLDTLTKTLGIHFKEKESLDENFNVFASEGFGPVVYSEFFINKDNLDKKLLTLEIDKATNVSSSTIIKKYPKAQINNSSFDDQFCKSFSVSKSWGGIVFGFDCDDALKSIVFDSR